MVFVLAIYSWLCVTGCSCRAISVALEFPHVEVVGVDLAPNTARYAYHRSVVELTKCMRYS